MAVKPNLRHLRQIIPLYGDIPLFWGLFTKRPKTEQIPFFKVIRSLSLFFVMVYALPMRVFFRYNQGIYTIGWLLGIYCTVTIMFFNWAERETVFTPLYPIYFPINEFLAVEDQPIDENQILIPDLPPAPGIDYDIFLPEDPWWPSAFHNVRSPGLRVFMVIFFFLTVFHIISSYLKKQKGPEKTQRGISWLWHIGTTRFRKLPKEKNHPIWYIMEASIFALIGLLLWGTIDKTFGLFLLWSSGCYLALELVEDRWIEYTTP